jgi:drug/metabolite transporter (DMT)-like permease
VVLIWGLNFSVMKGALGSLSPLVFNAVRFTLSVAFLGLWSLREGVALPTGAAVRRLVALGLVGHVGYQSAFILGLDRTTSGNSALLIASSPLWTAVFAHLGGIERVRRGAWLGLGLAFLGTAQLAVAGSGLELGSEHLSGNLLTLAAAAAWGVYTVLSKPLLERTSSAQVAFWSMSAALPAMWAIAAPDVGRVAWSELAPATWLAVAYSGVFSSGLAYVLWNVGIQRIGAARTSVTVNLVPLVALVAGVLFLGERVVLPQLVGGAMVIAGLLWMRRARLAGAQRGSK